MRPVHRPRRVLGTLIAAAGAAAGLITPLTVAAPGAVAAPAAAGLSTSLSFSTLSLLNGWHSEQNTYSTGTPAVSKDTSTGMVYLAGSLAGGSSAEAFVLPIGDRPASNLYLPSYTLDTTQGSVDISTTGAVYLYGASSAGYTSLAGISFPANHAKGVAFTTLALKNGWHSEQSAYGTGNPAVAKLSNGLVVLAGSLAHGSTSATAFVLPSADRPSAVVNLRIYTNGVTYGSVYIRTDGEVEVYGPYAYKFASLAGLSFPAATTSLSFTNGHLVNGWHYVSATGTKRPGYALGSNGVVYLRGSVAGTTTTKPAFTLPAAERPRHYLYISSWTVSSTAGALLVEPNGTVWPFGGNALTQSSLDGISFSTKS